MSDRLADMALFLAVVDAGGLAAGGRRQGLSPASVSERLVRMETQAGTRLLTRTTRSIRLTAEGEVFAQAARAILAEVDDLDARLRDGAHRISGQLRISAPADLGRNRIARIIDDFLERHLAISVELALSDGLEDLVTEGLDFAIRYGALADSGLRVRKLADNRRLVCASPIYLAEHGVPQTPNDLTRHDCLIMRFGAVRNDRWRFRHGKREFEVAVKGRRCANDGDLIRQWAIAGHGIAMKSVWDIQDDVAAGRLVPVLDEFGVANNGLQIVYPAGREPPRRSRALMDAIAANFASATI